MEHETINLLNLLEWARNQDIIVSVTSGSGVISAKKLDTNKSLETNDIMDVVEFIYENVGD